MHSPSGSMPPVHEMCGALHLHTKYSDGGVEFPELIDVAIKAGLDFIVVTDHMSLRGRQEGFEGFSGQLFVVVGYEHNDIDNKNHYLALGATRVMKSGLPQQYIDEIRNDGGIGFLAHPVERRHYFKDYPSYPWTSWEVTGFDGIELWNQMSDWLEHLKSWFNFFRLFYPRRFLARADKEIVQRWDNYNRNGFKSAIGGVDAHTMKKKIGIFRLTIFPIKVELKGIRTHLFFDSPLPRNDPQRARELFLDALKNGRGFVSNYRRNDARGTRFFIEGSDGDWALPGRPEKNVSLPACLHVQLVEKAQIVLLRNGAIVQKHRGASAQFDVTAPGLYRVEVCKGKNVWIYSNPFPVGNYPLW
jgi:hypothetical protein